LPPLSKTFLTKNTHLRFSNNSNKFVSFYYNGRPIIQIAYERISFIWRTTNGIDFEWIYVP
jgi:hypothetical protein